MRRLDRHQAREVAIERCDGQVVETLLAAGVTVVVISPNQLKNLRSRYGQARKDLVNHRVALCNQLRAHLKAFYPAPVSCSTSWTG